MSLKAFRPVVHHVSVKPPSPPVVTVLQAPAGDPLVPDLVPQLPQPLLPQTDMGQEVEELDHSTVTNQALIQLQQVRGHRAMCWVMNGLDDVGLGFFG